jgi:hypothetical protein
MNTVTRTQTLPQRSILAGVAAAAALSLAAFVPAASSSRAPGASLGAYGSANAVEQRLLSHLAGDLGAFGSANAVEHRLLSHLATNLGVGSANVAEHLLSR